MKKKVIFDFDGVLAKSELIMFEAVNFSLGKLRMPKIEFDEFSNNAKIDLLKAQKLSSLRFIALVFMAKRYMKKHNRRIKKNKTLINGLKELNLELHIISSNSKKNIIDILGDDHKLFSSITGSVGLFKKHKVLKSKTDHEVYITDEVRDIMACKKVGLKVYACSWGADPEKALRDALADKVFITPLDLLNTLKTLQ